MASESKRCRSGIITGGTCDENVVYPVPSAGSSAFYTTWSFGLCGVSVGAIVIYLLLHVFPSMQTSAALRYILLPLGLMGAANSIGVFVVSQLMLAYNFKLEGEDDGKPKSLKTSFFNSIMNVNLKAHIAPAAVSIFSLLLLALVGKSSINLWLNGWQFFGITMAWWLSFLFLYLIVPIPKKRKTLDAQDDTDDEEESEGEDETTTPCVWGFEKLQWVYNDPDAYMWVVMAVSVFVVAAMGSFIIV
jgi:hypothetical protein